MFEKGHVKLLVSVFEVEAFFFRQIPVFVDLLDVASADYAIVCAPDVACEWSILLKIEHHTFVIFFLMAFGLVEILHSRNHFLTRFLTIVKGMFDNLFWLKTISLRLLLHGPSCRVCLIA